MDYGKPRPFRPGPIEPVAQVGEYVLLIESQMYSLYRISFIEPLPESDRLICNIGAIAASTTAALFNTQNVLDMPDGMLSQLRARLWDDIAVDVWLPQSTGRFGLRNLQSRWNAYGQMNDPCGHTTELFLREQGRPILQATNPRPFALAQARVGFYGFKYALEGKDGKNGGLLTPILRFNTIEDARRGAGTPFTVSPVGGWGQ